MKKYGKFIAFALALFFTLMIPCFAKTMDINGLEKELKKIQPGAGYVYIIGEYAFTSEYKLELSDIVLASNSMDNGGNKTDKTKVNIYQLIRKLDEDYNPVGLEKAANALGTGELPETFDIRYIDYVHIGETTPTNVEFNVDDPKYSIYKNVLNERLGFEASKFYSGNLTNENGKIKGILLRKSIEDVSLNAADKAKYANAQYFLAYIIEVPGATNKTTVKKTGLDRIQTAIPLSAFDVPVGTPGKTPGIVILTPIDLEKIKDNKKIIYTIDLDGDEDLYGPYDYVIDLSELTFQTDSKATINETNADIITEADKKVFTDDWGYDSSLNNNVTISSQENNTYEVSGKLVEQTLKSGVYGEGQETGYYFDFTFVLENNTNKKAVISSLKSSEIKTENIEKTFKAEEYDENGNLTILIRIDPNDNCSGDSCKAYFSVDLDGEGDEYLPVIYTLDYSGVTKEKSSVFTVDGMASGEKDKFGDDAWYDTNNGYSVTVKQDNSDTKKYYVSGVLPIIEDEDWNGNEPNEFKDKYINYYLGLKLTLLNGIDNFEPQSSTINVKFDHEQNQPSLLSTTDFAESKTLYLLKALKASAENSGPLSSAEKWFTITIDLDGEDGDEYEPYTVTIDYSDLEFQTDSLSGVDFDIIDESSLTDGSPEKQELEKYNFNPDTIKDVSIKTEANGGEDREPSKTGLEGTIKEQTLNEEAKFTNNTGYFVPIKIALPTSDEWYDKHKADWTITLYTEDGSEKVYNPTEAERNQGWLLVLFRLDKNKGEKVLKYTLDFDGDGKAFLPTEYEIKYDSLNYQTENKVIFEYFDEATGNTIKTDPVTVYQGEVISPELIPSLDDENYAYHTFDYWYDSAKGTDEQIDFNSKTTGEDEDLTVKAHWTIDIDKFFNDVVEDLADSKSEISDDYSDIFEVSKDGNAITFKVLNYTTKLSELNGTSIPGAIAYILQRGEVKDITLSVGEKYVVFTKEGANNQVLQKTALDGDGTALKEKIQAGAKALFVDVLGGTDAEQNMTLNAMALAKDNNNFTISIGSLDGSVALEDDASSEYTFAFTTDVAGVSTDEELKNALSSERVSHIQILDDITVSEAYNVNRDVVITGKHDGGNYTLTANENVENIFNVNSNSVTIENVKLKAATKEAIVLTSGSLTTKDVTIEYDGDSLPSTVEAAIKVEAGTLTASNMTFAKEHYNTPLVKAKTGSIVNLTDKDNLQAVAKDKAEITNTPNGNDTKKDIIDEYKNYHNDSHNAKIYTTELMTHEGGARLHFLKYNYYNESVKPITGVSQFESFTSEGKKFTMYGYTKVSYQNLYEKATVEENAAKDGVIKANDLKATSDEGYWVVYTVEEAPNAASVTDKDTLLAALSNSEKTSVYIPDSTTIDMQGANLEINHDIAIYTKSSNPATITNIGKITISASDVSFNRINLEVKGSSEQDSLIEVTGSKFSFWQGGLKNIGDEVDYAIKYKDDKSVVDVRYMGIGGSSGFDGTKIKEAYIYVDGKITDGSDLYLNTFAAGPKGAIKINGFEGANKEDDIYGIRFLSNTVRTTEYAMKLTSNVSGQEADIRFGKGKVIVEYTDSQNDFDGVNLLVDKQEDPDIYYQKSGGSEEPSKEVPAGGSGIKVSTSVQSSSPIETTISGLSQNEEGTYSGTLTQDEDGKFYLPLVITSSQLQDRKSKVKITDPNENTTEYLYTSSNENGYTTIANIANSWPLKAISSIQAISEAAPQNNGTMKINLEALKASKAKEGKVYTIAFDYDGDGTYDEPQTIDYSEVKTEEEIILDAAKNTQDAKSLTVTKNNKINGLEEDFSYQYDTEKDVTLYSENNEDNEYTFRYNKVDTTHNGDIIIAVRKFVEADTNTCKNDVCVPTINGWTFANFFKKISRGYHELSLLQDLIKKDNEIVDAISKVSKVQDQEHKYEVTLNQTRLNDWLNNAYLSSEYFDPNQKDNSASPDEGNTNDNAVVLEVELDENDKYIVSIKTKADFSVTSNEGQKHDDNKIDVKFENPNNTTIKDALEFLGESEGTQATLDEIKEFYEACKKWHTVQTGATIFEE